MVSPSSGSVWTTDHVRVTDVGFDAIDGNPLPYSRVTAAIARNGTNFGSTIAFPTIELLWAGSAAPDQRAEGVVDVVVDRADELPVRVEMEPLTFGVSEQERDIAIVEELLAPEDWWTARQ